MVSAEIPLQYSVKYANGLNQSRGGKEVEIKDY